MNLIHTNKTVFVLAMLLSLNSFAQTSMEKEFAGVEQTATQVDTDRANAELLKMAQDAEQARLKYLADIATIVSRVIGETENSVIAQLRKDFGGNGEVVESINTSVRQILFKKEHAESYQLKLVKLDNGFICQFVGSAIKKYSGEQGAKCVSSQYGTKLFGNQLRLITFRAIDAAYDQALQGNYSERAILSCVEAAKEAYKKMATADIRNILASSFYPSYYWLNEETQRQRETLNEKLSLSVGSNTLLTRCYSK